MPVTREERKALEKYCKRYSFTDERISFKANRMFAYFTDQDDVDYRVDFRTIRRKKKPKFNSVLNKKHWFEVTAKKIHGDKYDYSKLSDIFFITDKVTLICPVHGEFKIRARNHIEQRQGCDRCRRDKLKLKKEWKTQLRLKTN